MRIGFTASIIVLALNIASSQLALCKTDLDARQESAAKIIAANQAFCAQSRYLIAQAEKSTAEAKVLSGGTKKYQTLVPLHPRHLSGKELRGARIMYQGDLKQFAEHARMYQAHTDEVHRQYGQCAASRHAYERNKDAYTLHCSDFHLKNIPPPHICIQLGTSMAEARAMQGKMMGSMKQLAEAEANLMANEERLGKAQADSDRVDADVSKQNELNLKEQGLVEEFGRLQEEYRQLNVEHKTLAGSPSRIPVKSVHAKIHHK